MRVARRGRDDDYDCRAGLTAERSGHDLKGAREPSGSLGAQWEQVGQGFSKRAASAGLIIAEKAPHVQQQADHVFTDRQIACGTAVATMHRSDGC